jgi:hypothetical protein
MDSLRVGDIVKQAIQRPGGNSLHQTSGMSGFAMASHWGIYVGSGQVISLNGQGYVQIESSDGYEFHRRGPAEYADSVAQVAREHYNKGGRYGYNFYKKTASISQNSVWRRGPLGMVPMDRCS